MVVYTLLRPKTTDHSTLAPADIISTAQSQGSSSSRTAFLASLGVSHQEVLQPWVWLWLREMKGQCVGQQIYRAVWGTHTFMNKSCTEPTGLVWLAALTLYSTVNRFTFKLGLDMPEHTHTR